MHVLITGGAGFIGSHLVDLHLANADKVHVVDDLSTGSLANIQSHFDNPRFRFTEADLLTWSGLQQAVGWSDRVYHMAAVVGVYRVLEEPIKVLATNVAGTERLLRAVHASGWQPQVVVASSSEVYGPESRSLLEEGDELRLRSDASTRWNYAISKLADEALGLSYANRLDLHVTVVRLFNTIGPRQSGRYGMVVPRFIEQAVAGEPITVHGDGTQQRCFCDVRDTVRAFELLLANPESKGEIVNVGADVPCSIGELAEIIRDRAGSSSPIEHIPYEQAYGISFEDFHERMPNIAKLHSLTGLEYRFSLERTLDELIAERKRTTSPAVFLVNARE